jgi:hypothetical protein
MSNTGHGEGGENSESRQIEILADNIVGASALNRRRLVRVFDAINVTHFLLLLVRIRFCPELSPLSQSCVLLSLVV